MNDLLKEGYDYEDYTDNVMQEEKSCCKDKSQDSARCGCQAAGIPIKK